MHFLMECERIRALSENVGGWKFGGRQNRAFIKKVQAESESDL